MHIVVLLLDGEWLVIECPSKGEAYRWADDFRTTHPDCKTRITIYRVTAKEEV